MSQLSDYVYKKYLGYPAALPFHLRNFQGTGKVKLHNDWVWPFTLIPRSWSAMGPRCGKGNPGYMSWPPKLVEGTGVTRWENSAASSCLEIPDLFAFRSSHSVYGRTFSCIEQNPGHPNFKQVGTVLLDWHEAVVTEECMDIGDFMPNVKCITDVTPNDYSPSALQKFSMQGQMKLDCGYSSSWQIITRREIPGAETGTDTVNFKRTGSRPDHQDVYYNIDTTAWIPHLSRRWN